jgi:diguanylate cyclase (GGDEF)-like protein/PAS domain S-box-containing protein
MSGSLSLELLLRLVQASPDGIAICEKGADSWPVVFVNEAFERLTGYKSKELHGKDLRLLQAEDREQETRQRVRQAMAEGTACRVLMRNYRMDGTRFWNEMSLVPIKNAKGDITHYAGFHRDASERMRLDNRSSMPRENGSPAATVGGTAFNAARDDRLTGLHNRAYFEELLKRDWAIAQRDNRRLALILFDIDALGAYNDTFGRTAGDSCIKRVGRAIGGCLRRSSDLMARWEGGTIISLVQGMTVEQALPFADAIRDRVRETRIHHPRSPVERYVTVSCGAASMVPGTDDAPELLLERAKAALRIAKSGGRNRVAVSAK